MCFMEAVRFNKYVLIHSVSHQAFVECLLNTSLTEMFPGGQTQGMRDLSTRVLLDLLSW